MSRIHLTDRQWAFVHPCLPHPACTWRLRANDRRTIEEILDVLIMGCRWQDLPREYGALATVWRRLNRWERLFGVYRSGFASAVMLLCVALSCCVCAERLPSRA